MLGLDDTVTHGAREIETGKQAQAQAQGQGADAAERGSTLVTLVPEATHYAARPLDAPLHPPGRSLGPSSPGSTRSGAWCTRPCPSRS